MVLLLIAAVALSLANLVVKRSEVKPAGILGSVAWPCMFAPLPLFALAGAYAGSGVFTELPPSRCWYRYLHCFFSGLILGAVTTTFHHRFNVKLLSRGGK